MFPLPLAKPGLKIALAKMQSYLYFSHTLSAGVNVASACLHVQVYVYVCVFKPFFSFSLSLLEQNNKGKEADEPLHSVREA